MSDARLRPGSVLGDRYRVVRALGAGGSATVLLAYDLKHGRPVAIKALRPDVAATVGSDRFLAEIATTAQLRHPNILPLFDSGEADGVLFFVMPWVEGASLRARLETGGPLPIEEAVDIAATLAAALEHAHRQGVIHRDIKPDNILLCDGVPILADFGIARALERAGTRLTETGVAPGTVAYMSPEQAAGETGVDARTDIYSLGCVLYEALCGELPHAARSVHALLARRMSELPTPVRVLRPTVPEHVDAAVQRALATLPADRFATADAFATALRTEEQGVFVLRAEPRSYGVLMHEGDDAVLRGARQQTRTAVEAAVESCGGVLRESPGDAVVAVFRDVAACLDCARLAREAVDRLNGGRPSAEHVHYRFGMADGAEQAIDLATIAPTAAIRLSGPLQDRLGRETGEARPAHEAEPADSLPPQLEGIEVPPPDRPSIAIIPFSSIGGDPDGEAIAEGLRIDITNALMKMERIFLVAPSSMNHFRGAAALDVARHVGTRHVLEGSVRRAGRRVRVAIQLTDVETRGLVWTERYDRVLDDAFDLQDEIAARVITELDVKLSLGEQARVWRKCLTHPAAREHYYRGLSHFFRSTRDAVAAARNEFERVAELVPESPVGATWAALALWLQATRGWDADASRLAVAWAERAAAMPDADGQAHTVLGATLLLERRWDEAVRTARDSVRIRPGCNTANGILANVLLHCEEYDDAILHAKRAIRIGPVYPPWFLEILSAANRESNRLKEAITVGREIVRLAPEAVSGRLVLATALVRAGFVAEARQLTREVSALEPGFSLDRHLANQPFRSDSVREAIRTDLLRIGVP